MDKCRDNCYIKRNSSTIFKLTGLQWRIKGPDNNYLIMNLTKDGQCVIKIAFSPEENYKKIYNRLP